MLRLLLVTILLQSALCDDEPFWLQLDSWGPCSVTCGLGVQRKEMNCATKENYGSIVLQPPEKCKELAMQLSNHTRPCNLGSCKPGSYVWRYIGASGCSQTCGPAGIKSIEMQCHFIVTQEAGKTRTTTQETILADHKKCDPDNLPNLKEKCNRIDCIPKFYPEKWQRCRKSRRKCSPGRQNRNINCVIMTKKGEPKNTPLHFCYSNKARPPIRWRLCYDYINTAECLKLKNLKPVISESEITVVQMRKATKIKLQVGQTAYIIPWTRVIANCPVEHYIKGDIIWKHGSETYKYQGKMKSRIKIDRKGRLKIKKFLAEDNGAWTCVAGGTTADLIMKVHSPSSGYQDWASRNSIWNEEMMNEDPRRSLLRSEIVQWVEGAWSACSKTCGGEGTQRREVRCERVDSRFYHILDHKACSDKLLPKPLTTRKCKTSDDCPIWKLEVRNKTVCTDKCVRIGTGTFDAKLTCEHMGQDMSYGSCNPLKKPDIECKNPSCQVKWNISEWSSCSKSCGGTGVSARRLICTWLLSKQPAGQLCYDVHLEIPQVVRSCKAPPCRLKCVDLSPHCGKKKKLCRFILYRFKCCKSCMT